MRQTVSVDIVLGSVNSNSVGIEAAERITQKFAHRFIVSKNFIKYSEPSHSILFKVANDRDSFSQSSDDQRRFPGQVAGSNQQIQGRVTHTARFTDKREPHIGFLLF